MPDRSVPAAMPAQDAPRRSRPLLTLEVLRREQLTPHMVRIIAGGPNFERFVENGCADAYCKIWFGPDGKPLDGKSELESLRQDFPREEWPVSRTYTIRSVNSAARELAIDFVVHGDEGLAGPWAAQATAGEALTFAGPAGAFSPDPDAGWYLFAADESALPATAAVLEALPASAVGQVFLEVGGPEDRQPLTAPAGVTVSWLYRGDLPAGNTGLLAAAVAAAPWPNNDVQVFAHGEREAMKALRDIFFAGHGLERRQVSLSGYWAAGRTEDAFQAEKKTPVGKIL
ncbi:siderophore-interacting protein [Arthrobacter sp. zg-Y820]|uniref:siderophore-interacting protein n=1 Tax=unclassified Arthrobacter TaxID=235627 RepID=UPI001E55F16F|nr:MULTISPECIES: siderophore-interacting protein [unclassified Arthrobacter]MCC9198593.1 siderophore-interacting protein [Arthrobacter sp. zg-Y820]MDK1281463.1 siderophore-interacting protein [Arthrobacter sp. zg.Y820]MDK1361834.1 siderophore-interacting protein [Arthrobacter sp. zg-Y1219]WIB09904.1 siderophore-interacting protein [Arthrobacter sp. zg-Y820]